jgi:hypothetical protein
MLRNAKELICANMMCPRLGQPCMCKLAAVLHRLHELRFLDLSTNSIDCMPEAFVTSESHPKLIGVDISDNQLLDLPRTLLELGLEVCPPLLVVQ